MSDRAGVSEGERPDAEFEGLLAAVVITAKQLGISESQENRLIYGSREIRRQRLGNAEHALRERVRTLITEARSAGQLAVVDAFHAEGIGND